MADDAGGVTAVFGAVRGVDLVVDAALGWSEDDVFVDATSLDVTFAAVLNVLEVLPGMVRPSLSSALSSAASPYPNR